jgi:hypothetical protein
MVSLPVFGLAFAFVNKVLTDTASSSFSSPIIVIIDFKKPHHLLNPGVKVFLEALVHNFSITVLLKVL